MKLPALLRRSVRAKLTALTMATSLVALLLTAVALLHYMVRDYRATQLTDVRTQAAVLGRASAAALAFDDRKEAQRNLGVLAARPDIEQAALYDAEGRLFAAYVRDAAASPPAAVPSPDVAAGDGRLKLLHRVHEGGQFLGSVYLESADRLTERVTTYALILAGVMGVSLMAALLLSAWLQRVLTASILNVSRAAQAVVERRDFSVRAQSTSEDEIGALAKAFNRMLEEIDRRTNALVESEQRFRTIADSAPVLMWLNDESGAVFVNKAYLDFLGVRGQRDAGGFEWARHLHPDDRSQYLGAWQRSIDEGSLFDQEFRFRRHDGLYRWMRSVAVPRIDAEGRCVGFTGCTVDVHDARLMSDALREADRRKDEFLATLAHELRNPLAPIRNAVALLEAGGDARRTLDVQRMLERQVNHMVRLVDDLIDVSRISRGTIELEREPLDVGRLLWSAVEISRPLIDRARHRLDVRAPAQPLRVHGDAVRLTQVIANLLNNAAKYSEDGGRIELEARQEGDEVAILVRDHGIGLAADQLPRLFEMFSQLESGTARARGGLGIGLSLSQRLVQMHGGVIVASSEGRGRGSCFVVRLPRLAGDGTDAPDDAATPPSPGLDGHRMLVVDDNRDAADSLALLLQTLGARVDVAHDGMAALECFERVRPNIVLLDLGMPGMDGLEVARRLRERADGHALTLVALTGWGQPQDRERTQAAGFDHHVVKPVEVEALQALLGRGGA